VLGTAVRRAAAATSTPLTHMPVSLPPAPPPPPAALCHSFLFKDQFIELTTAVPGDSDLYGLGEASLQQGLLLPRDGTIKTMWARDAAPTEADINTYGAHPFYLQVNKGKATGPAAGAVHCGSLNSPPSGVYLLVSDALRSTHTAAVTGLGPIQQQRSSCARLTTSLLHCCCRRHCPGCVSAQQQRHGRDP
jgi:hypothetical protein